MKRRRLNLILRAHNSHNLYMTVKCTVRDQRTKPQILCRCFRERQVQDLDCKHPHQATPEDWESFWNKIFRRALIHVTTSCQTKCLLNFLSLHWMMITWEHLVLLFRINLTKLRSFSRRNNKSSMAPSNNNLNKLDSALLSQTKTLQRYKWVIDHPQARKHQREEASKHSKC